MERPYVYVHMLTSIDGRITGPFMDHELTKEIGATYGKCRTELQADAWLYGATTTKEFLNFRKQEEEETTEVPDGDFIVNDHANLYYISVDTEGEIGWESGTFVNKGRPESHVVELITEKVPSKYRSYLRRRGVSYILVGEKSLDCKLAIEKLYRLFNIKKLIVCGSGILNYSFFEVNLFLELQIERLNNGELLNLKFKITKKLDKVEFIKIMY